MLKYILGGVGLTLIAIGAQNYIDALKPYSKLFISVGTVTFLIPVVIGTIRFFTNKSALPKGIYYSGSDLSVKFGVTPFELKQRVEKGLPAYIKSSEAYRTDNLRKVTERDLTGLEVWHETANNEINNWLFKSEDVEKHIKKT